MTERWTPEQLIALARRGLHDAIKNGHDNGAYHKARELYRLLQLYKNKCLWREGRSAESR